MKTPKVEACGSHDFVPRLTYSNRMVRDIGFIEAARAVLDVLPLPPDASLLLRHRALEKSTRSSTQIEGNPLGPSEVRHAIAGGARKGSNAEQEVRNYWRALDRVDEFTNSNGSLTEGFIRELHRVVIVRGPGRRGRASRYRSSECPVVNTLSRAIEYGPPEPADVEVLLKQMLRWLHSRAALELHPAVRAGILTHRFLSIHPFDDGNGRTGRLLATAELWRSGYRMRGFLSFEEHFSSARERYYESLHMGLPVNFYDGRNDPDHTPWLEYFVQILAQASEELRLKAIALHDAGGRSRAPWETLKRRQQQVLTRLLTINLEDASRALEVRASDLEEWFGVSANTARDWLRTWTQAGFLVPVLAGLGQRVRRFRLAGQWERLVKKARAADSDSTSGTVDDGG